jgi:hypothetical protein
LLFNSQISTHFVIKAFPRQTIEPLNYNVERMETPPFFRLTKRQHTMTSVDEEGKAAEAVSQAHPPMDKGQIHTKRISAEDPSRLVAAAEQSVDYCNQLFTFNINYLLRHSCAGSTSSVRSETSNVSSLGGNLRGIITQEGTK